MRVISLGWGVQSWALAAMSALGVLPEVDYAIHSDTGWEKTATKNFIKKWEPWLVERGMKVITAKPLYQGELYNYPGAGPCIPAYADYEDSGNIGMLHRQCTVHWKIRPVRKEIRKLTRKYNIPIRKEPHAVKMWLGITEDEKHRVSKSDVDYIQNIYPFLEFSPPWTREDVKQWLLDNDLEIPPKSSCIICPYHNNDDWRKIRNSPADWEIAKEADKNIRTMHTEAKCYLHKSCLPLKELLLWRQNKLI